jgi:hypothetical protein
VDEDVMVLEVVGSEPEAEMLCSLLRSEGIRCAYRMTNSAAGESIGMSTGGPREVVVRPEDLESARSVVEQQRPS